MTNSNEIAILLFGRLSTELGTTSTSYTIESTIQISELIDALTTKNDSWRILTAPDIKCAVNQSLAEQSTLVKAGDEVAFFPPVTGG